MDSKIFLYKIHNDTYSVCEYTKQECYQWKLKNWMQKFFMLNSPKKNNKFLWIPIHHLHSTSIENKNKIKTMPTPSKKYVMYESTVYYLCIPVHHLILHPSDT